MKLRGWAVGRARLVAAGLLTLVLLAVAVYLLWALGGLQQLRALLGGLRALGERLGALAEEAGPWAPLAYVAAKAATFGVLSPASPPLNVASGAVFGFPAGLALTAIADTLAGCALFGLARYLGRRPVARVVGERVMKHVDRALDKGLGGWRELAFFRLVVPIPYNFVSLAAGLARGLSFREYLAATLVADAIAEAHVVALGAGLAAGAAGQWARVLYIGIAVFSVAALLARRRVRDAVVRLLRSKPAEDERHDRDPQDEKGRGKGRAGRRASARSGEDDPS